MIATPNLIKSEIDRLHQRESSDWMSLFRQVNKQFRPVKWNWAQIMSQNLTPTVSILYNEWGRGTGKSQDLTKKMKEAAETMPRGLGIFTVPTYSMFHTEIYSSLVTGFEMNGWFEGLHYWVGKEPPKSWRIPTPYKRMKDFSRTIYTHTGFVYVVASQGANNAGVGLSTDVNFSDESALLGWQYLSTVIFPTVRGSGSRMVQADFKRMSKYFMKHFFNSSTPMLPHGQELLYGFENGAFSGDLERLGVGGVKILRANWRFNKQNLAENFAAKQKVLMPDNITFDAQIENIRPPAVTGGYYVALNKDIHTYMPLETGIYTPDCRKDSDLRAGLKLILSIDWGDTINSMAVRQMRGREIRDLNFLFVLGDKNEMQDDLAQKFHDYYQFHDEKYIELWYDKTGNTKVGNSRKTRAQQFAAYLRNLGWSVSLQTKGKRNVSHDKKRQLWENILREGKDQWGRERHDPRFPTYRMNILNCAALWTSMKNTPAKMGAEGEVVKNKGSERASSGVLPQHATHGGDAADAHTWGAFHPLLRLLGIEIQDDAD
jgi:hypothetical protein